jgi:hypothetical protein
METTNPAAPPPTAIAAKLGLTMLPKAQPTTSAANESYGCVSFADVPIGLCVHQWTQKISILLLHCAN